MRVLETLLAEAAAVWPPADDWHSNR